MRRLKVATSDAVAALLVAPLTDLSLSNNERYIWLVADPDSDLDIERAAEASIDLDDEPKPVEHPAAPMLRIGDFQPISAEPPERECWVDYNATEIGWAETLFWDAHGGEEIASCLLERGIAPGQPFLVHFHSPHTYRSGGFDSYYEYDFEWEADIVKVEPWSREHVAEAWAAWLAAGAT